MFKQTLRVISVAAALLLAQALVLLTSERASAVEWNFYMHQSAPNFATSRGAKMFTERIEKATNGELKVRLHLVCGKPPEPVIRAEFQDDDRRFCCERDLHSSPAAATRSPV